MTGDQKVFSSGSWVTDVLVFVVLAFLTVALFFAELFYLLAYPFRKSHPSQWLRRPMPRFRFSLIRSVLMGSPIDQMQQTPARSA
jgi:hypothetical protein